MFDWLKPKKAGRNDDTVRLREEQLQRENRLEQEKRERLNRLKTDERTSHSDSSQELFWKKTNNRQNTTHANRTNGDRSNGYRTNEQRQTVDESLAKQSQVESGDFITQEIQRNYKGLTLKGALIWSIVLIVAQFLVHWGTEHIYPSYDLAYTTQIILSYVKFFISIFFCSLFGLWLLTHADRIKFVVIFILSNVFISPVISAIYIVFISEDPSYFSELLYDGAYVSRLISRIDYIQYEIYRAVFLYFSLLVSGKIIRNKLSNY